jgi:mono/diheme cytochrome c family protein
MAIRTPFVAVGILLAISAWAVAQSEPVNIPQELAAAAGLTSSEPTFTKDVLPIIQDNCQICHRRQGLNLGGMVAPMALMTYEDVKAYAVEIEMAVGSGYMPPWHAAREHIGTFAHVDRPGNRHALNLDCEWQSAWRARRSAAAR